MLKIKIYTEKEQDSDFYSIMGRHFASLEHKNELGGWQLYNKQESIWILLFKEETLVGFCAYFKNKDHYYLDNFLILKEFRNLGYSKFLLKESLNNFKNQVIKTMSNNIIQIKNFESFNFKQIGIIGSYLKFKLEN
jgi:ribosomal protein S18 acetylase RimI-like enzyme